MSGTGLSTKYGFISLIITTSLWGRYDQFPILQWENSGKEKLTSQGHTEMKWWWSWQTQSGCRVWAVTSSTVLLSFVVELFVYRFAFMSLQLCVTRQCMYICVCPWVCIYSVCCGCLCIHHPVLVCVCVCVSRHCLLTLLPNPAPRWNLNNN